MSRSRFRLAWRALDEADAMSAEAVARGGLRARRKDDGSPVTDLDLAIERLLTSRIGAAFPGDATLGEETGQVGDGDRLWVVDPIDGTSNLLEGLPVYAHTVAYVRAGRPEFALVSAPGLGRRWWAERGRGAFADGAPISVSAVASVAEARICYGGLRDYTESSATALVGLARRCRRSRAFGNFLPHMLVAEGTYDLASSAPGGAVWDLLPLQLIVREAGGVLTAFDGGVPDGASPVLTSNGLLHDTAVAALGGAV